MRQDQVQGVSTDVCRACDVLTQTVLCEHVDGVRIQLAGGVSWHVEVADNDKSGAEEDDMVEHVRQRKALCKALRWGYNGNVKLLSELLHDADMKLFRSMLRNTHYIHQLLPPLKYIPMKFRTSHCAFVLPYCHYSLYKHSFVLRCIFDGAYWLSSCQPACVCCLCLLLLLLFTGIVCLFDFFSFQFFFIVKLSYSLYAVFLCYLMAFDCQELKGLLTYLLKC